MLPQVGAGNRELKIGMGNIFDDVNGYLSKGKEIVGDVQKTVKDVSGAASTTGENTGINGGSTAMKTGVVVNASPAAADNATHPNTTAMLLAAGAGAGLGLLLGGWKYAIGGAAVGGGGAYLVTR